MSLYVADRSIPTAGVLSEGCQRVLHLVDGADAWLLWAIGTSEQRYQFADESQLLDGIQKGLHGAVLAWLPRAGLQVSPSKLLSLGANDLDALWRVEQGESGSELAEQVASVLARHALLTNAMLQSSRSFLSAIGAGDAPLLQQLDFRASVGLWHLAAEHGAAADGGDSGRPAEAAFFALQHARQPLEFCDYYRFYLHARHPDGTAGQRLANASHALHALRPLLFDALDGTQVDHLPSLQETQEVVYVMLAERRPIGFTRISLAVQQVAQALCDAPLDERALRAASGHLLRDVQAALRKYRLQHGQLGQDGASLRFPIEAPGVHIVLQVEDNLITLAEYVSSSGDRVRAAEATPDARHSDHGGAELAEPQDLAAARAQAEQTLASAKAALLHMPGARAGAAPDSSADRDIPLPVRASDSALPEDGRAPPTSPLQVAQALADAAMAASEQAIREAMAASQQAIDAANDALRRADAAAEEAVRRATEAAAEDQARWKDRR